MNTTAEKWTAADAERFRVWLLTKRNVKGREIGSEVAGHRVNRKATLRAVPYGDQWNLYWKTAKETP